MYRISGWINIVLLITITSPFWLHVLNTYIFKAKEKAFNHTIAFLRKLHKPLGVVLLLWALYHGYIAWGGLLPLNTGMFVWLAVAVTASLGLTFFLTKKKAVFKAHKTAALCIVLLFLIHLFFPYLLS